VIVILVGAAPKVSVIWSAVGSLWCRVLGHMSTPYAPHRALPSALPAYNYYTPIIIFLICFWDSNFYINATSS